MLQKWKRGCGESFKMQRVCPSPLSCVHVCFPVSVCARRFQLSPRFVVAIKCCPPGEILDAAPFSLSCSSCFFARDNRTNSASGFPCLHSACSASTASAVILQRRPPLPVCLCVLFSPLYKVRDAPLVCSETLLGFFFFFPSFSLAATLLHDHRQ